MSERIGGITIGSYNQQEFQHIFGKEHGGLLEQYRCEDAEVVLVAAGSVASTAKDVVDSLRSKGTRAGLARIRSFRPIPNDEFKVLAGKVDGLAVPDRSYTFGATGAMYTEVKAAVGSSQKRPAMKNYIVGLGGRDITPKVIEKIFEDMFMNRRREEQSEVEWVDVAGLPRRWHRCRRPQSQRRSSRILAALLVPDAGRTS